MMGFPSGSVIKESACQCRSHRRHRLDPWVGRITWRRKWQPNPVLLPGKAHGQGAWRATVHGVKRVGHDLQLKQQQQHSLNRGEDAGVWCTDLRNDVPPDSCQQISSKDELFSAYFSNLLQLGKNLTSTPKSVSLYNSHFLVHLTP